MHNRYKEQKIVDYDVPISVVEQMYGDMVNGDSFVSIKRRFNGGGYGAEMKDKDFDVALTALARYTQLNIATLDEDERARMYARYLAVYKTALDNGLLREAKGTLDSMVQLLGVGKNKDNAVKIEKGDSDTINISFGLKEE